MIRLDKLAKLISLKKNIPENLINRFNVTTSLKDIPKVETEVNNFLENTQKINSIIGGKEYTSNQIFEYKSPIYNTKSIVEYSHINQYDLKYLLHQNDNNLDVFERMDIFKRAADLIQNKYYNKLLAATIVGQGKTPYEAEIDVICEMVDFLNFNIMYTNNLHRKQPVSTYNILNYSDYIPLNGLVHSITPFNFSAIGGNLATAPLFLGNTVFWKPSESSLLSNKLLYDIFIESGVPEDQLNFVVANPEEYLNTITEDSNLAAILFTGSTDVFSNIYQKVGNNIHKYNNYPRLIGETGGKNFHFIDTSCDIELAIQETFQSAFNFSGQKCSACSRVYVPDKYYERFIDGLIEHIEDMDKDLYGLINKDAYLRTVDLIDNLKQDENSKILYGGEYNSDKTYYIQPTIIENRHNRDIFSDEYFAPILAVHRYTNKEDAINKIKNDSQYALTGAIFSNRINDIDYLYNELNFTCGNFYINTKSTGAVVGQQPFGGFGKSGTNDKAGDINLLYRLCNQKNTKMIIED